MKIEITVSKGRIFACVVTNDGKIISSVDIPEDHNLLPLLTPLVNILRANTEKTSNKQSNQDPPPSWLDDSVEMPASQAPEPWEERRPSPLNGLLFPEMM